MRTPATRPAAGVNVDETRSVPLLAVPPQPCVAIALPGVTVFLDKTELERMAASRPDPSRNETERQAFIAAHRARDILKRVVPTKDEPGLFVTSAPIGTDAEHLVLAALESGAAAVRDAATGAFASLACIRYSGVQLRPLSGRGFISVSLPDAGFPFLEVNWWVS